jgi:TRAP-type mannitol/chloroaromatic compound transport system permease small subunit
MSGWKKLPRYVDYLSLKSGALGKWFAFLLVLIGAYETVARHFFNAPTIWAYDSLCMSGGVVYMLGASYVLLKDSHTRVDVIYSRLSRRKQAWIDVIGALIFFFPLMTVMLKMAVQWAIRAWKINEVMFNSFWYPPAAPYRTVFAVGLFLLVLQGLAKFTRDVYFLAKGEELD